MNLKTKYFSVKYKYDFFHFLLKKHQETSTLYIFSTLILNSIGSSGIILMAPSLYDIREPIDAKHTTIGF